MTDQNHKGIRKIPRFLFRYLRDNEHLVDTLLTPYLWFSDPASLNDPFDLTNVLDFGGTSEEVTSYFRRYLDPDRIDTHRDLLKEAIETKESPIWEHARQILAVTHQIYLERVALCCFSFTNDSTLMWSHYSAAHTGVCLVIGVSPELLREYSLIEVQYCRELPRWNMITNRIRYGESMSYNSSFDQVVLGSKYLHWEYENEYRLISRKRGKHMISAHNIVGLILGARMNVERKAELKAAIEARFPHVKVIGAQLDHSNGVVVAPGFENVRINVGVSHWRLLDDDPSKLRDVLGGPASFSPSNPLELNVGPPPWKYSFHLKIFDPSYRTLPDGSIDYDFDSLVNAEVSAKHLLTEAFLIPKPGSRATAPVSPYEHVADIINLVLDQMKQADRCKIEVGSDYILSWCGEPGYQLSCSHGLLDIMAVAARVELTYLSSEYYDLEPNPANATLLQHWSTGGVVTLSRC